VTSQVLSSTGTQLVAMGTVLSRGCRERPVRASWAAKCPSG